MNVHPSFSEALGGISVLLVAPRADDDLVDPLRLALRADGAHVIRATEPAEALTFVTAVLPRGVVVTMITFPRQTRDGYWLLQALRRGRRSATIPVVGVVRNELTIDTTAAAGFAALLTRPNGNELVAAVRELLGGCDI